MSFRLEIDGMEIDAGSWSDMPAPVTAPRARTATVTYTLANAAGSIGSLLRALPPTELTLHACGETLPVRNLGPGSGGDWLVDVWPDDWERFAREIRLDEDALDRMSWEGPQR